MSDWRPSASLAVLAERARLLAATRSFFAERGVLEVETPLLGRASVTDVHLASLSTRLAGADATFYLQTSPEYAMKRLLAAGSGDIYQVCKAFRDEPGGRHHNPEFTLIEWYRTGWDHRALMDEVEALLVRLLGSRLREPAERLSYAAAFERVLRVDPHSASIEALAGLAAERIGADAATHGGERDTLLELLMGALVGPALGAGRITFIDGYPASQAALARLLPGLPATAARFEAYVEGIELCNGFHELGDATEQRGRFEADLRARGARRLPAVPIDERLLGALSAGLPDSAGVALGFDRVVMLATGVGSLRAALPFTVDGA